MATLALEPAPYEFPGGVTVEASPPPAGDVAGVLTFPERLFLALSPNDRPLLRIGTRVLGQQALAEGSARSHAPTSGVLLDVVSRPSIDRPGRQIPCLVLQADGRDERIDPVAMTGTLADIDLATVIHRVRAAGVVGMGGAGYPTHAKLDIAHAAQVHTLIVNAVECEPGVTADAALLRSHARDVLHGAATVAAALGLTHCLIALDERDSVTVRALLAAWSAIRDEAPQRLRWRCHAVAPRYPAGAERSLVRALLGIALGPSERPTQRGVVCFNAATLFAVHRAVWHGEPLTRRLLSLTGSHPRQTGNHWVCVGHPVKELAATEGCRVIRGGRVAGQPVDLDASVTKTTLALDFQTPAPHTEQPCIRCQRCSAVCPELLRPERLLDHARAGDVSGADREGLDRCIECGACDLVCPSGIGLLAQFRRAKSERFRLADAAERAADAYARHERHDQRIAARVTNADADRRARRRRRRAPGGH